jgi:hypothetical protein
VDTGQRWAGQASPRDLTKVRQQQLLREKAAREKRASESVDVAAIRKAAWGEGFEAGHKAAYDWLTGLMEDAGIDPDILVITDEDQSDEADGK